MNLQELSLSVNFGKQMQVDPNEALCNSILKQAALFPNISNLQKGQRNKDSLYDR